MKKFAIGCLIVVAVLGVALGVGGYLFYSNFVKPYAGSFKQLAELPDLDKQITNTTPFRVPDSGELSDEMVKRFIKVQEQLQAKLGPRMDELKAKYDQLDKGMKSENRKASFSEAMTAMKDLTSVLVEAKKAQVQALNEAGYSLREYSWVRNRVYEAVGIVPGTFDIGEMARRGRAGEAVGRPEVREPEEVPAKNKTLVAPYQKQLEQWAPLAFFGL